MIGPRPDPPADWRVLDKVTLEPQIVIRIAKALAVEADVFDVEASLRRLAENGLVVRHRAGPGVPVMWSVQGRQQ